MPHCQYFDPKGVNFMTPMSKKKQCGQDYDKDVMIAGFPLLFNAFNPIQGRGVPGTSRRKNPIFCKNSKCQGKVPQTL